MPLRLLVFLWFTLCSLRCFCATNNVFTLVIDAGHGGKDVGARGKTSNEKDINLKVALAFGQLVERNCKDVNVVYTRKTDVFIPLHERASKANKCKADLFISIHTNALPKGKIARGIETYTLGMHRATDNLEVAKRENSVILIEDNYQQRYEGFDPRSSESYIIFELMQERDMERSVELARLMQKHMCSSSGRANKGVKQAGFLVLRETTMPSCLIELGFITTPDEERYLTSKAGIDALSNGIYKAFLDYKNLYAKGSNPTFVSTSAKKEEITERNISQSQQTSIETSAKDNSLPIFKVQIFASKRLLKKGAKEFKGLRNVEYYQENELYKYTVGASNDYKEISHLRKETANTFPEAFIIAFKNGQRMDVNEAITEYQKSK